jgi:hypothetical protein
VKSRNFNSHWAAFPNPLQGAAIAQIVFGFDSVERKTHPPENFRRKHGSQKDGGKFCEAALTRIACSVC